MITHDVRYAVRMLARNPGFSAVAVLALALGIGANSAIFSFTNAYMLRPLPYPGYEQLHFTRLVEIPSERVSRSPKFGELLAWQESSRTAERVVGIRFTALNVTETNPPEQILGVHASSGFFELLGAPPLLGRTFNASDDTPDGRRVAVLSYGLWQRTGARPDIVGRTMHLNGEPHTVVGVMPASFRFPTPEFQVWVPLGLRHDEAGREQPVVALFRLRPGSGIAAAGAELGEIARRVERGNSSRAAWQVNTVPLYDLLNHVREASPSILVLTGAAGFVLLIACANLANLLLARATVRRREIAIRRAIGAGRAQLIRQMLVEATLLSLAGGAIGLFVAWAGVRALVAVCPTWVLPLGGVELDMSVVWFTAGVSILAGVLFGVVPAFQISRGSLAGDMKESGRTTATGRHWIRRLLVVSEMSASVVLLIGAGLLIRSLYGGNGELGFRPDNLLTMDIALPEVRYASESSAAVFYREVTERIARTPGVVSAGAVARFRNGAIFADGKSASAEADQVDAGIYSATPEYLATLGVHLRSGRWFTGSEGEKSQPVAVVNESLAKRLWPGADAIGRTVRVGAEDKTWRTVIGVFSDARANPLEMVKPEVYVPHAQKPSRGMQIVLRTAGDPAQMASAARAQIAAVDPHQAISKIRTMNELMAFQIAPQRVTSGMLSVFAAVALLLAATGIYGVMAYSVSQRTHEFGVRVALGASREHIGGMVLREAGLLALAGTLIGLLGAYGLTRLMRAILYGVSATDVVTFTAVPLVLSLIVVAAAALPAMRATQVDPITALRCD